MQTMSSHILKDILSEGKQFCDEMFWIYFEYLVYLDYIDYIDYLVHFLVAELDGNQAMFFYYIDLSYAMKHHAGKAKFKNVLGKG